MYPNAFLFSYRGKKTLGKMKTEKEKLIYTVGHSTHALDYFRELLESQQINSVVDVRQVAASTYNPQYNGKVLKDYLQQHQIVYVHMGEEFGARSRDLALLDEEGRMDFDKVRQSKSFQNGVERLKKGLQKGYRIALMCSQSDPFDCHHFALIAYYLVHHGFTVKHILKDKTCIDNTVLERLLLEKYRKKLPQRDLFNHIGDQERLEVAYRLRGKSIAYKPFA